MKLIAYLLLICITLYSSGSFLFFKTKQYVIKKKVKQYLAENKNSINDTLYIDNHTLANNNTICWKDDGEEILYKGIMYDVLKIIPVPDGLKIICFKDVEETKLLQVFLHINKNKNLPPDTVSIKLLVAVFVVENFFTVNPFHQQLHQLYSSYSARIYSFYSTSHWQPPKYFI